MVEDQISPLQMYNIWSVALNHTSLWKTTTVGTDPQLNCRLPEETIKAASELSTH